MSKKLYRSKNGAKILGVCQGFADYFEIDVTIVRIIYLLLSIGSLGIGAILYFLIALIMPEM